MNSTDRQIYINIPVQDLPRAQDFYTRLGFPLDDRYSSDGAACMIVNGHIHLMLHTEDNMKRFTSKPIVHAVASTGVILCLTCSSREEVDHLVQTATSAGGTAQSEAVVNDEIYSHGFQDLDGHIWKINHAP